MQERSYSDANALALEIVERLDGDVRLALPLGLGKANRVANSLYSLAKADASVRLVIFTALTLEIPKPRSDLEQRMLVPILEEKFNGVPELDYVTDIRADALPANIDIVEFFLTPGAFLSSEYVQQHYASINYSHASRDLVTRGVNVVAQMVARESSRSGTRYSLACNPDVTLDLMARATRERGSQPLLVGEVNDELPFMEGDAVVPEQAIDLLLDDGEVSRLFPVFNEPVSLAQHAIAFRAAALVADGGTLQIGIGGMGDAIAHAIGLRHADNSGFKSVASALDIDVEGLDAFDVGLYGSSEMFVEGFLHLFRQGVMKRRVDGAWLHAGFFLGSEQFYEALRGMERGDRDGIRMMPISFTNQLLGDEDGRRHAREKARFMNSAMMVTLLGAVVSDGLDDGRVVSGVGGQFDFVSMAHELEGARSIILLPATRVKNGETRSNIVWNYGHTTIPRHLRDVVVTEYGVADLRGASDAQVIERLLGIADVRSQASLKQSAIAAGKLPGDYVLPVACTNNRPEVLAAKLRASGAITRLPHYPIGTDLTQEEAALRIALTALANASDDRLLLARWFIEGRARVQDARVRPCLQRMSLGEPTSISEYVKRALVARALNAEVLDTGRPLSC